MRNEHIKALDGLRFVAAGAVVIGHGVWIILLLQIQENITPLSSLVLSLNNIGMTLFFVLSGFVIHFNYNDVLQKSAGLKKFFVARWSRLYPLFFLVFAIQLVLSARHQGVTLNMLYSLPFYLTFTQTWWFWTFDHSYSGDAYGGVTSVMWSLSTEVFFYSVYPFLVAPVLRNLRSRTAFVAMWPIGAGGVVLSCLAVAWRGELSDWAVGYFQSPSGAQFGHWVVYNSPWMRIFEFLLGALAAQIVMGGWRLPARYADALAIASLITIAAVFVPICYQQLPYGANVTTCLAPFFALLCVAGASADSRFSQIFGSRPMVWGGEASYSLYLLHFFVLHVFALRYLALRGYDARLFGLIAAWVAAIMLARVSFVFFERPAMRLTRNMAFGGRKWPDGALSAPTIPH